MYPTAIVPANRSNAFELFADTYTGGTYTLSGTDAAAFQIAADGAITSTALQQFIAGGDNERVIVRTYTQGENVFNETITITLTEAPSGSQTTVRAASTEIDVEDLKVLLSILLAMVPRLELQLALQCKSCSIC